MNRAVCAWLYIYWRVFLGRCPGFAPGWYELPPLASLGTFDENVQTPLQLGELPEISRGLSEATPPGGRHNDVCTPAGVPEPWPGVTRLCDPARVVSCSERVPGVSSLTPQPPANFWQASGLHPGASRSCRFVDRSRPGIQLSDESSVRIVASAKSNSTWHTPWL